MLPRNISFPGGNFIGGLDEPGQPMPLKMSHFIGLYKLGAVPYTVVKYEYSYRKVLYLPYYRMEPTTVQYCTCYLLPTTYYLLPATYYLLPTTY